MPAIMLTPTAPRRKPVPTKSLKASPEILEQILAGRITAAMTFNQKVWAVCSRVPKGRVITYADIARALGGKAYRAVGNALNKNPHAPTVPCHRVVGSSGALTGFAGGLEKKTRLLREEGIEVRNARVAMSEEVRFEL